MPAQRRQLFFVAFVFLLLRKTSGRITLQLQNPYYMKKITNIFKVVKTVVDVIGAILCTIKRKTSKDNQNPIPEQTVTQG